MVAYTKEGIQKHVIITGPGRSGTTMLMELLTHLDLDTGYDKKDVLDQKDKISRAGLERMNIFFGSPYIIKNPNFVNIMHPILRDSRIKIDRLFMPIRDLEEAAESRRVAENLGAPTGGLIATDSMKKGDQENVLSTQFWSLIEISSQYQVPITFINYPLMTQDSEYLYNKLKPILEDITLEKFNRVFKKVVQPILVNHYKKD